MPFSLYEKPSIWAIGPILFGLFRDLFSVSDLYLSSLPPPLLLSLCLLIVLLKKKILPLFYLPLKSPPKAPYPFSPNPRKQYVVNSISSSNNPLQSYLPPSSIENVLRLHENLLNIKANAYFGVIILLHSSAAFKVLTLSFCLNSFLS